jgi:hypothetical protein
MAKTPKKTRSTSSSVDPATQYAMDVTSGKELAGPDIRNACQRHLRDLNLAMHEVCIGMLRRRSAPLIILRKF